MNNREKVLKILFEESYREFHLRLLARLTKLNPNTVLTLTHTLANERIIKKHKHRDTRLVIVKANTESRDFKLLKQFYNIKKLYQSGLIDHLEKTYDHPTIILFGSYNKAENRPGSDIDLFIVTDYTRVCDVSQYSKKLGAEVQLFVHSRQEFNQIKKTSKELLNNVLNGYKLTGYLEVV